MISIDILEQVSAAVSRCKGNVERKPNNVLCAAGIWGRIHRSRVWLGEMAPIDINVRTDSLRNSSDALKRASFWIILAGAILLLAIAGVLVGWALTRTSTAIGFDSTVAGAAALIRSWGTWGMAASITLMVVHSFLPFPAEIVALANGLVYGAVWGAVLTWFGAMLGASAAFGLGRMLGRPVVERFLPSAYKQRLADWSHTRGSVTLLVSRMIPVIAFNMINYLAALTEISWWSYLWATALGILPLTILFAILGDRMLRMPLWAWLVLSVSIAASLIALHCRRRTK